MWYVLVASVATLIIVLAGTAVYMGEKHPDALMLIILIVGVILVVGVVILLSVEIATIVEQLFWGN